MKFSREFEISVNDADLNGAASAAAVFGYIQTAADLHYCSVGQSADRMRENDQVFLLSRLNLSLFTELFPHDVIRVESWPCESRGATFLRCARVFRDGETVAEAVTAWALLAPSTHRLLTVDDLPFPAEHFPPVETDLPARVRVPRDLMLHLMGEHTVTYSETDVNGHLHNTRYPDLFCDVMPQMKGKRVARLSVAYLKEAPLGETLKIYGCEDDGCQWFRSVREDGAVNAEAQVVFERTDLTEET